MPLIRIFSFSRIVFQPSHSNPTLKLNATQINKTSRLVSTAGPKVHQKSGLKHEKEKLGTLVVQRYVEYVQNYTKLLENRFPAAMRMYRVFSVGIKDFYNDLKTFLILRRKVKRDRGFSNLSRQEIELYQKMPADMWRIAPVLILSAIPFGNYVVFPLAFLKPRKLLCSHFWSIQQRSEFLTLELQERLKHNRPVFRFLQAKLDLVPEDCPERDKWRTIVAQLGSGVHPTTKDIINCKPMFSQGPYALDGLSYAHCGQLLQMHGLRKGVFRVNKLKYRAFLLLEMDKAILKEGGAESLSTEVLRHACHLRGLNGTHLSNQDMISWLQQWLSVSQVVDKNSYSLLLHCPIFLAYNHPQNWVLIY